MYEYSLVNVVVVDLLVVVAVVVVVFVIVVVVLELVYRVTGGCSLWGRVIDLTVTD